MLKLVKLMWTIQLFFEFKTFCQRVVVVGVASSSLRVLSGVLQGLVLGLVLFLIYVDWWYWLGIKALNNSTFLRTKALLYSKIESQQDRVNFQAHLLLLEYWGTHSKMTFNVAKCQLLIFPPNGSISPSYLV